MSKQKELTQKGLAAVDAGENTGSTAAQISILSEKITNLQQHMQKNRKDKHSNRGLLQMVADRRRLIKYMKRTDAEAWATLAEKIGLKA